MDILYKKIRSLSLKQIAYTVAAADAGNVSEAARRLNVSQPAISAAILALEDLFGLRLFVRKPGQGVELTSFGASVMHEARDLLTRLESFSSLADPDQAPRGQVVLSCYRDLAPFFLPRLLRHLAEVVPGVSVRFIEVDLEGVPESLARDNADLGLTLNLGLDPEFPTRMLAKLAPRILCAQDHPLTHRRSIQADDLAQEAFILLDQTVIGRRQIEVLAASGIEPTVAARVATPALQRSMVAHGFGVALAYFPVVEDASCDGLPIASMPAPPEIPPERLALTRLPQPRYHPAVEAVYNGIVAFFAGGGAAVLGMPESDLETDRRAGYG